MKKRKVGMLTFHDTNNFGSWLQTYGLYKKLLDLGVDIEVIDYQCNEIIKREKITINKVYLSMQSGNTNEYKFLWDKLKKQIWLSIYSAKFLKKSREKYFKNNIIQANNKYDLFIIGSDLVWDTRITGNDFTYMLDFAEKEKEKISYAASIGYEKIPENQLEKYKKLLDRFQYITVREKAAENMLRGLIDVPISVVSDPTALLTKKEWLTFVKKKNKYGKYVLIYFTDDKKQIVRLAKKYACKHKCEVIIISEGSIDRKVQCIVPFRISEFLSLIYYAQKVFTASYHGLMFSLYFEKQLAYSNRNPEARMRYVAEKFGIKNLEIHNEAFDVENTINYKKISPLLKTFRKESIQCLKAMVGIKE